MNRKLPTMLALFTACSFITTAASAGMIFQDNFNSENGGVANSSTLNYTGFANWTVDSGFVDLIGNGYYDFQPGNGLYLDLDGSGGAAGTIASLSLTLGPGDYVLSYDLAGNHRTNVPDSVTATVETGHSSRVVSLPRNAPFTTYVDSFSLGTTKDVKIQFSAAGADNVGMLLDNVQLQSVVPEPTTATLWSVIGGIGLLVRPRRRRR